MCFCFLFCSQVGEMAPDKIQSAGKHLAVERTLSEEQCKHTPTHTKREGLGNLSLDVCYWTWRCSKNIQLGHILI